MPFFFSLYDDDMLIKKQVITYLDRERNSKRMKIKSTWKKTKILFPRSATDENNRIKCLKFETERSIINEIECDKNPNPMNKHFMEERSEEREKKNRLAFMVL